MPSFDLLSEPWLPVLDAGADLREAPDAPASLRLVGLREARDKELDAPRRGDARTPPAPHGLDMDAVASLYEAVLLVLDSDVVIALRKTIVELLERIEGRLEAAAAAGANRSLGQAQWLKVRSGASPVHSSCEGASRANARSLRVVDCGGAAGLRPHFYVAH